VIVVHGKVTAKVDGQGQMVELLKSMRSRLSNPDSMRIYRAHPVGAPLFQVMWDMEFESLTALEQWNREFWADPEYVEDWKKWRSLLEPGGDSTLWTLVE
jgi:hypothetical protein